MMALRSVLMLGVVQLLILAAAEPAARVPQAILLQANREARVEVARQMAGRHPELLNAYQRLAASVQPIVEAQAEVNQRQADRSALDAPIQKTLHEMQQLEKAGYREGNTLYVPGNVKYMLEQCQKKLDDLDEQAQTLDGRLKVAQRRHSDSVAEYNAASQEYTNQMRAFQTEFDQLYRPAYAEHLKTLTAQYEQQQAKLSQVYIVTEFLPGKYDWLEGGGKPVDVEITADGGISGVPPGAQEGTWEVTDEGLAVTIGKEEWLFKPGPAHTLMGSHKEPGSTIVKRSAILQPKVLPDEGAYKAALQKLKDAREAQAAAAATAQAGAAKKPEAEQTAATDTHVLKVEVLIDGESWLVLQGGKVHWENKLYNLPGASDREHPNGPYPTVLDGKDWTPVWKGRDSEPTDLPFSLPADLSTVSAKARIVRGRGRADVLSRGDALVLDISDPLPGADSYTIELTISEAGATAGPSLPASAGAPSPAAGAPQAPAGSPATQPAAPGAAVVHSDYEAIGVGNGASMPEPSTVHVGAHEWQDVADQDWLMVSTRYHRLYFKPSSDRRKVERLYQCLDNIYTFQSARSATLRKPPIDAYLIPGERGHSRCCLSGSMRTGDNGDFAFNLTSFVHEETHLFNFVYLGGFGQSNWSGEFACLYYQQRTQLALEGTDPRGYILKSLPDGPQCALGAIEAAGQAAFGEAFAANYLLETFYGTAKHTQFRLGRLQMDRDRGTGAATGPLLHQVFGKDAQQLDAEWKAFYGWDKREAPAVPPTAPAAAPEALHGVAVGPPGALALAVVRELSSPVYAGRVAGSEGEAQAARYVESAFRAIGLAPVGGEGFSRSFSVPFRDLVGPVGLWVGQQQFAYMKDFGVMEGGPQRWVEAPVVFAGYGRNTAGADDWRGVQANGCVVMLLVPRGSKPDARAWKGARDSGAVAALLVDPPGAAAAAAYTRKNVSGGASMPVLHVSPQVGETLLAGTGWSLERLLQAGDAHDGWPILRQRVRVAAGAVEVTDARSANIVAVINGRSPRCVLVLAHYDAQGRAGDSRFFPGANDNASGVGVMLEVAQMLARRHAGLPVSVVFAAVGAEEIGLCGSRELVRDPPFPLRNVAVALNLDMVGGGDGNITVQTTGEQMPDYVRLAALASRRGLSIKPYVREHLGSDAGPVQAAGVPTLFLITGGGEQHAVGDDAGNVSQKVMADVAGLVVEFISGYAG